MKAKRPLVLNTLPGRPALRRSAGSVQSPEE